MLYNHKIKKMYKIKHRQTQFIQYMNAKETANFFIKNRVTDYSCEKLNTIDSSEIIIPLILISSILLLTFIVLQF